MRFTRMFKSMYFWFIFHVLKTLNYKLLNANLVISCCNFTSNCRTRIELTNFWILFYWQMSLFIWKTKICEIKVLFFYQDSFMDFRMFFYLNCDIFIWHFFHSLLCDWSFVNLCLFSTAHFIFWSYKFSGITF